MTGLRFIPLFAGLAEFHHALGLLGSTCLFAWEIDPGLADLYERNFDIRPHGDIREAVDELPPRDILYAGFPCQPFSKADDRLGFDRSQWGDLFDCVLKILDTHKPRRLLLENAPNLLRHDVGRSFGQYEIGLAS
ncbi:MAG: DNA cytosine methyltransferase [Methylacidiphilaceae bacterium]|nr:DNA cytosine methyltransferase [Candidatus Methylacidiphilaceae bacterium]